MPPLFLRSKSNKLTNHQPLDPIFLIYSRFATINQPDPQTGTQMQRKLKNKFLNKVHRLKEDAEYYSPDLIKLSGQVAYDNLAKYYNNIGSKLKKEILAMPTGVRYTGTFYLRVPYSEPPKYDKMEGSSLFMKEDVSSWRVENDEERRYSYYRDVLKSVDPRVELTKDDSVLVYEKAEQKIKEVEEGCLLIPGKKIPS